MNKQVEAIRKEIERRKKEIKDHNFYLDNTEEVTGYSLALDDLLSFIDSLPDGKPMSEDLEEEIINYWGRWPEDKDKIELARHFAEWGRMRFRDTKKSQNKMSENIGQLKKIAAQAYVAQLVLNGKAPDGLTIFPLREIAENAFIYGAEWGAKHLKTIKNENY